MVNTEGDDPMDVSDQYSVSSDDSSSVGEGDCSDHSETDSEETDSEKTDSEEEEPAPVPIPRLQ